MVDILSLIISVKFKESKVNKSDVFFFYDR